MLKSTKLKSKSYQKQQQKVSTIQTDESQNSTDESLL